jgi:hypothetical protein
MSDTPPPIPNPAVHHGARRSPDDEGSMSLIRRAAVLLRTKADSLCTTPGARYRIRMQDNMIACAVTLPNDLGMTVGELLDRMPYLAQYIEEDIHDMMANAAENVIKKIRSAVLCRDIDDFWRKNEEENLGHKVLPDHLLSRLDRKEPPL